MILLFGVFPILENIIATNVHKCMERVLLLKNDPHYLMSGQLITPLGQAEPPS